MSNYYKGCIFVILSAVIFGCMPLGTKILYAGGANAITTVFLRNLLAMPLLFVLLKLKRPDLCLKISKSQAFKIIILSLFGLVLTPVLLFSSYNFILTGAATTIHFNYPIFVLLGCAVFLGEKITPVSALCVILCTLGIFMFYTPDSGFNLFGVALAFVSGITYAAYVVYLSKSKITEMHPFLLSLYMSICAAAMLLSYALATDNLRLSLTPLAWLVAFIFSLSLTVGAIVLFQIGTSIIGPQKAAIFSTFEPITSILVGLLVFKEQLSVKIIIGMLLILSAVVVLSIYGKTQNEQKNESDNASPSSN